MGAEERDALALIKRGALERLQDFEHRGQPVLASRLGYRMTSRFAIAGFGRVFLHPHVVFTEEMLRPELQDVDVFADAVANIVATHQRVAESYFADGSIEMACPPLKALLEIMAHGQSAQGYNARFARVAGDVSTRESVLASDWYAARLDAKQRSDEARWTRAAGALYEFLDRADNAAVTARLGLAERRTKAQAERACGSARRSTVVR